MKPLPSLSLVLAAALLAGCASFHVPFYERATKARPAPPSSATSEVSEDGQKIWIKEGGGEEKESQRQADISNCYAYARAQTAHDSQIQADRLDTGRQAGIGGEEASFMTRMDEFELGKQRDALFSRCMRAKGYSKS